MLVSGIGIALLKFDPQIPRPLCIFQTPLKFPCYHDHESNATKKNCAVPRDAVLSVMSVTDVDSVLSVNYYVHWTSGRCSVSVRMATSSSRQGGRRPSSRRTFITLKSSSCWMSLQGASSARVPRSYILSTSYVLRFWMFHSPALAVGSYNSGPPSCGTPKI